MQSKRQIQIESLIGQRCVRCTTKVCKVQGISCASAALGIVCCMQLCPHLAQPKCLYTLGTYFLVVAVRHVDSQSWCYRESVGDCKQIVTRYNKERKEMKIHLFVTRSVIFYTCVSKEIFRKSLVSMTKKDKRY